MPRGGARLISGPAPDPNALKRDRDKGDWIHLRAREGDPPAWPLIRPTRREKTLWASEWKRPQAVMWERLGLTVQVALYVRTLVDAEDPDSRTKLDARKVVIAQMGELGITTAGLARNRWIIDEEPALDARPSATSERASTKARLRAITGGAA